jgi:hypothetical protein
MQDLSSDRIEGNMYLGNDYFSAWFSEKFSVFVHEILSIGHSTQRLSNNLF